jgi:hypothetical protein
MIFNPETAHQGLRDDGNTCREEGDRKSQAGTIATEKKAGITL